MTTFCISQIGDVTFNFLFKADKLFSNIISVSFVIVVWKYPEESPLVCLGTELGYELMNLGF